MNYYVYDVAFNGSKMFIGGGFSLVDGQARTGFASFNRNNETVDNIDFLLTKNGSTSGVTLKLGIKS